MYKLIDEDYKAIDLTVKIIQDMRMRNKIKTMCKVFLIAIISTILAYLVPVPLSINILQPCFFVLSTIFRYIIAIITSILLASILLYPENHFTNHDLLKMECKVDKASL